MLNHIDILVVFRIEEDSQSVAKMVPIFSDCFSLDLNKIYANEYKMKHFI